MDEFIEKHEIDVGRTFGILIFSSMVAAIYGVIGDLLLANHLNLNVGIIIMFFLGRGMYRHNNTARKWVIGITISAAILIVGVAIGSQFWNGFYLTLGERKISDPPLWKVIIFILLAAPLIWASLSALFSEKAKKEFKIVEQVSGHNSGGCAPSA